MRNGVDNNLIDIISARIETLIQEARNHVSRAVNVAEVLTKFEIGRILIEVIQDGEVRASYGKELLKGVSDPFETVWIRLVVRYIGKMSYLLSSIFKIRNTVAEI